MSLIDVEIVITDQTRPLTQKGFGLPLILGTSTDQDYAEYTTIQAVAEDYDATDDEYKAAQAIFRQSPHPQRVAIYSFERDETPEEGDLATELNKLVQLHNDWYWLVYAPREQEADDLVDLADWVSSAGKFAVLTNEPGDASSIVSQMTTVAGLMEASRVVLFAHTHPDSFPDAALVGRMAPIQPGGATFKFKTLDGVPEARFGTTQILALHDAGVNTYVRKFGVLQTSEGFVSDKTYADIQLAKDWLKARMEERISRVLFVNEKIPYDNIGIAQVIDPIRTTLKQGTGLGLIARGDDGTGLFEVRAPRREDIDPNDRANRILPDVNWDAIVAGAVHNVKVNGVVRV
ncbi:MAG: DUF3383 domain-containing protein [Firmicutes bacterium]|nr:DUF3383 domain-containing protein [Bacillota bacterium]